MNNESKRVTSVSNATSGTGTISLSQPRLSQHIHSTEYILLIILFRSSATAKVSIHEHTTTKSYTMSEAKVLVYHHQPRGEPIVSKGLDTMQHSELEAALKKGAIIWQSRRVVTVLIVTAESGSLQLSKKAIPSGATHVEITPRDLLSKVRYRYRELVIMCSAD